MKIQHTHFNVEAVKDLTLKQFKELYKGISFNDLSLEDVYYKITGKTKRKPKEEDK